MEQVAATTKLNEVDVLRMQVTRLLARVAAKDAEFAQERAAYKRQLFDLQREVRELRKAQRHAA